MQSYTVVESTAEFKDAKQYLEGKKRFVEMTLNEGRASSAESQVRAFHDLMEQHKNVLQKHSKYWEYVVLIA